MLGKICKEIDTGGNHSRIRCRYLCVRMLSVWNDALKHCDDNWFGHSVSTFLPCVLLNLSFIPIRISAGGHHADSPVKCYVLSTLLIAALLAILKWVSVSLLAAWILILAASAVLLWLAPVETENNPLDKTEVRVYRRRTRIVLGIELLAALLATLLHRNFLVTIIGFGLLTASFMLVVGACANLKQHWKRCV